MCVRVCMHVCVYIYIYTYYIYIYIYLRIFIYIFTYIYIYIHVYYIYIYIYTCQILSQILSNQCTSRGNCGVVLVYIFCILHYCSKKHRCILQHPWLQNGSISLLIWVEDVYCCGNINCWGRLFYFKYYCVEHIFTISMKQPVCFYVNMY